MQDRRAKEVGQAGHGSGAVSRGKQDRRDRQGARVQQCSAGKLDRGTGRV